MALITDTSYVNCWDSRMVNDTTYADIVCNNFGKCLPNPKYKDKYFCRCDVQREPLTNCSKTIFEMENYFATIQSYIILGYILHGIPLILFTLELLSTIKTNKGKNVFNVINGAKATAILWTIFKIVSIALFHLGFVYKTTTYAKYQSTTHFISIGLLILTTFVVVIHWFGLLMRSKNLGTEKLSFKIIRIATMVWCATLIPLTVLSACMNTFYVQVQIWGILTQYLTFVTIILPALINIVYSIRVLVWFKKILISNPTNKKIKRLRVKTYFILLANGLLLLDIIIYLLTSFLPDQVTSSVLFKTIIVKYVEIIICFALLGFSQNFIHREGSGFFKAYAEIWIHDNTVKSTTSTEMTDEKGTTSSTQKKSSNVKNSNSTSSTIDISAIVEVNDKSED